jgi:hypothetical protein
MQRWTTPKTSSIADASESEKSSMSATDEIRRLNDNFRTQLSGGRLMLTRGIAGRPDVEEILARVAAFDAFAPDNDPYSEHDFGAFDQQGDKIFWKIDYYDTALKAGSPDPADSTLTMRVLTIMLAVEY